MNYDDLADRVAADIGMLGAALQGLYLSRMTPGRIVGVADVLQFLSAANGIRSSVNAQIVAKLDAWRQHLLADTDKVELVTQHASKTLAQIGNHMMAQLAQRMRYGKSNEERLLQHMGGAFGQLVQRRFEQVRLTATDAAGREWEASMLARVVAREFAVHSEFVARVSAYREAGIDTAYVTYSDPEHDDYGLAVDLTNEAGLEEIRSRLFHPNTSATLEAHAVQA
ncbi:hypothetical protein [Cupriavidus campinensis]|uniref:Uncharacterized protein n=1 Tax=Cupriavidus campinensis TaxID=151783 RepID=A0ABY3ESK0_9BURK|nr:hypothetical protein [Cupriavidus campinensis]TSP13950.1 hypothetical protein FGG12_05610 [Cupriavidus campinensis]